MNMWMRELQFLQVHGLYTTAQVLAAVACGCLLGYERQRRERPVGMLTGTLVALGSTLFVLAGRFLLEETNGGVDPSRISSLIISGIGFIGAGAILRSRFHVTGLASAATVWSLGALGILIGWGFVLLALLLAVLMALLMRLIPKMEHILFRGRFCLHAEIEVEASALDTVVEFLMENQISVEGPRPAADAGMHILLIDECGIESKRMLVGSLRSLEGVRRVIDRQRQRLLSAQ